MLIRSGIAFRAVGNFAQHLGLPFRETWFIDCSRKAMSYEAGNKMKQILHNHKLSTEIAKKKKKKRHENWFK